MSCYYYSPVRFFVYPNYFMCFKVEDYIREESAAAVHRQFGASKRFSEADKKQITMLIATSLQVTIATGRHGKHDNITLLISSVLQVTMEISFNDSHIQRTFFIWTSPHVTVTNSLNGHWYPWARNIYHTCNKYIHDNHASLSSLWVKETHY